MAKFYIPSKGPDSWKEFLAKPVKHWKTGYSARSLAYCWEEGQGFPKSVVDVFRSSPFELFHSIEFVLASFLRLMPASTAYTFRTVFLYGYRVMLMFSHTRYDG